MGPPAYVKSRLFQDIANALRAGGYVLVPKAQAARNALGTKNGSLARTFV